MDHDVLCNNKIFPSKLIPDQLAGPWNENKR